MARAKSSAGEPSKREMVKSALDELGNVGPTEIQDFIQQKYGTEISKAIISSYKSQLKTKGASSGAGRGAGKLSGSVDLRDLTAVQNLIHRIGAAQLQSIVKMLSK